MVEKRERERKSMQMQRYPQRTKPYKCKWARWVLCFLGVEKSTLGLVHLRKCRASERIQESQMPFKNISLIKLAKLSHYAFLGREGCLDGKKATKPETLAS